LGWLRAASVERCIAEHLSGSGQHGTRLWLILWLELWVRIVLEGSMGRDESLVGFAGNS